MDIFEIINYIINGHTIMEAVEHFNVSRTYIMKGLRKFKEDPSSNLILKEKLMLALLRNSLRGQKHGGTVGRKTFILSDEEALNLKKRKEEENLSYRDLENMTGIPYSTIRNAILRLDNIEDRGR